ncbi:hypothetical protein K443DRAFT_614582 [Laccaria amethystina LaAM-08-1]|uniref:Uncharacterized protein n=1 Tax=Laccaria amethystina LaAM-08-1 TaxID=1095629 RepID=A0A0C9X5B5_9AGAR|nr:hypothetical protein K443DRAFT_614582 [Laccaria amethystina LaAM-08-1]
MHIARANPNERSHSIAIMPEKSSLSRSAENCENGPDAGVCRLKKKKKKGGGGRREHLKFQHQPSINELSSRFPQILSASPKRPQIRNFGQGSAGDSSLPKKWFVRQNLRSGRRIAISRPKIRNSTG